ncbi:MAG: hypothetical protein KIT31_30050 [Deltaproteobacteria bacterium]|nr:hypothetical protein [Deltaproteobacteria bacterium]
MRYVVEVVQAYGLCPWAHTPPATAAIFGAHPPLDAWVAAAEQLLAAGAEVAMVIAPEAALDRRALAAIRVAVAARLPSAGVADFHPDAPLDLATPARAVPFLRRAPDPLLQLVPLAILDEVRARDAHGAPELRDQARLLGGHDATSHAPIADRIARANFATLARDAAQLTAALAAIDEDRRAAYARAGISARR